MKKIIFTALLLVGCLSFKLANAQVHVSVGVNIGAQPEWGPVGYDHVDYYYIPDVDAYYDVPAHQYVYYNNNVWVHSPYLPGPYRNYDIYHGYKVVVNRPNPWMYHREIRNRYIGFRGRRDQVIIRESHDERYRNHWHEDNGRHNGWGQQEYGNHGHREAQGYGNQGGYREQPNHESHGNGNRDRGDHEHGDNEHGNNEHGDHGNGDHGHGRDHNR